VATAVQIKEVEKPYLDKPGLGPPVSIELKYGGQRPPLQRMAETLLYKDADRIKERFFAEFTLSEMTRTLLPRPRDQDEMREQ
jgi:hypothetical protein